VREEILIDLVVTDSIFLLRLCKKWKTTKESTNTATLAIIKLMAILFFKDKFNFYLLLR
tara:strand:- start:103 stop:279 length:177 start_codon:yes stop_codon:yes gene_type:complete